MDKDLSTYAHNIKIVTQAGAVTLKGLVKSDDEKQKVAADAETVVSQDKVVNQTHRKAVIVRPACARRSKAIQEIFVMANKNTAVFGIYSTPTLAENAVDHLLSIGFSNSDISVLLPDDASTRAFAHEKNTKAPEGTATGVATGGIIGGTLGLLAGIGALAIPGVGPLIAAGPIMAALAGLGVGGTVGGIVGALVGMGIPEYEARRFEGAVKDGGTLLSVHCDASEDISRAKDALKATGARDIASSGEESSGKPHEHNQELVETAR